jgi:molybdate transport system substrate-binding protein
VIVPSGDRRSLRVLAVAAALAAAVLSLAAAQETASSRELRIFTTRSIATVLETTGADAERRIGRRLRLTTDVAARMVRRIKAGEPFDVLVAAPTHIDELVAAGTIVPDTRVDLARSGIGVAVRAGAPKPDVSSVEAFSRALLAARSVAYLKEGQSGVYLAGVIGRLGLADAIELKLTRPETDIVSELVARGDVELGLVVITQILTTKGVALAGPLPREIQSHITFTAGVSSRSTSIEAARALLAFLRSPEAASVMTAQGMEAVK